MKALLQKKIGLTCTEIILVLFYKDAEQQN
jgi:hypothetical protein